MLERTDSATYLGVELSSDLTWAAHINKTCKKANKSLAFLRRNLKIKDPKIKEMAYKGLVRPVLEYCSPVWNPHHSKYIDMLEMIQRRAARYTMNNYQTYSSVSDMIDRLGWESLAARRIRADIIIFYKIQNSLIAVPMPAAVRRPYRFKPETPHTFDKLFCYTVSYQQSFFPRIILQWNDLPPTIATMGSLDTFKAALAPHKF